MTLAIETLKRNTPAIILDAARRLNESDVAHYPEVATRLARMREIDQKQVTARKRADDVAKTIETIAQKRAAVVEALRDVEAACAKAAGEALIGDADAEKEYHTACFAVTKAERVVAMFDLGSPRLAEEHARLIAEVRGYGAQWTKINDELAEEQFKASITEINRRNAARR